MINKQVRKIAAVVMVFAFAMSFSLAAADTVINNYTAPSNVMVQFTRDLTIGSTGADVAALQGFLVEKGFLVMPAGVAMGYFGNLTKAATGAYQASVGITPSVGFFGPITRAYVSSHWTMTSNLPAGCTSTAGFSSTTGMRCDSGSTSTLPAGCSSTAGYSPTTGVKCDSSVSGGGTGNNGGPLSGGETSLSNFDAKSGTDANVNEADTKAEVMDFSFDVNDADAEVNRVDVHFDFTGTASGENKPWNTFDKVYLMRDSTVVASMDGSNENNWQHESGDEYRMRFTGLSEIIRENDSGKFTVAVDVANSVDGANTSDDSWDIWIPTDGLRATDSAGVDNFIGDSADTISFDIQQAGQDQELTFREASDNPQGPTLQVKDDQTSDWLTVLKAETTAKNGDIKLNDLPFFVKFIDQNGSTTSETHTSVVNDARLLIDGVSHDTFTWSSSTSTGTITFDVQDDNVTVNSGDTASIELQFRFNAADTTAPHYTSGTTVEADMRSVDVDNVDAEGSDTLGVDQLKGSADGKSLALRSAGISVAFVSSTESENEQTTSTTTDNTGEYSLTFDVTAFDQDQWVELTSASSAVATAVGIDYIIENSSNAAVGTGSSVSSLERVSGGTVDGNFVRVSDGQTARFKLNVSYDPSTTGFYRVQMTQIGFNVAESAADTHQALTPGEDFDSGLQLVHN